MSHASVRWLSGRMEGMTATLSPAGETAAVIVTHQRVELLRASLEQVVNQTHPVQ